MEFYTFLSQYDAVRRIAKDNRIPFGHNPGQWHKKVLQAGTDGIINVSKDGNALIAFKAERDWYLGGQPYYKIYPTMADMMSEVSIDIPSESFQVPYKSFAILLPKDERNDFRDPGGPQLSTILVYEPRLKVLDDGLFLASPTKEGDSRALFINYRFHKHIEHPSEFDDLLFHYVLALDNGKSIEENFEHGLETSKFIREKQTGYWPSRELIDRILRLSIATCFFGIDSHEVVLPDLPRRKIEKKMSQKNTDELTVLKQEKATHKEHTWTIGREVSLPRPMAEKTTHATDGGRQISHGYIRRGHMRWQAHGEGKKERKLIFIHPHMCRPDLPITTSKGFKIKDTP